MDDARIADLRTRRRVPIGPPRPIRRPIAEWIENVAESYPNRVYLAVASLPAMPFFLLSAIPFARAYGDALTTAGLLLIAAVLARHLRRRVLARRAAALVGTHACAACGYDLRATPYVCPECGAFATPPADWQPPDFARPPQP